MKRSARRDDLDENESRTVVPDRSIRVEPISLHASASIDGLPGPVKIFVNFFRPRAEVYAAERHGRLTISVVVNGVSTPERPVLQEWCCRENVIALLSSAEHQGWIIKWGSTLNASQRALRNELSFPPPSGTADESTFLANLVLAWARDPRQANHPFYGLVVNPKARGKAPVEPDAALALEPIQSGSTGFPQTVPQQCRRVQAAS